MLRSLFNTFFFGNYFYGICAVALSIEATLQQGFPFNSVLIYILIFSLTTWYYTIAYLTDGTTPALNARTYWYVKNKKFVNYSQTFFISIIIILLVYIIYKQKSFFANINMSHLILILIFPLSAFAYYGVTNIHTFNLRSIGWLKPFVIGFTWAGLTTVYPPIYYNVTHNLPELISLGGWWLFLKNFMFVSVLCILFDIKDYASDANQNIKTFVVHKGMRFTIFNLVIPLSLAGLISFLIFSRLNDFNALRIILNSLPFFALVAVAYSLHERKSIIFYLFIIDGLMLFKALCGICAFYLTK